MNDDLDDVGTNTDVRAATELAGGGDRVSLSGVRKEFGEVTAVDGIDLSVEPGEFIVLLGPSGCGKTTTLRMIAGLETVTDGSISIGSEDVTQTLPQRRDVSMVFQNYALYPHMSVRENLRFPLGKTELSDSAARERVERVANLLEIEPHLDKDPDQLSGGQRQRVALGRTIIREPRVFLMDEPLSNLDAKLRVQTRAQIRDLQQRLGTTTIYVTHDQEEALSLADRIVIMHDGAIEQVGPPEAVYTKPANEFVAGFLGDPAINFLDVSGTGPERTIFSADPISCETLGLELPDAAERVGIRPEDIYLATTDGDPKFSTDIDTPTAPVEMRLGVVEPLGHGYEATLRRGEVILTVRAANLEASAGETVTVVFDADRVVPFAGSGRRC